MEVLYQNSPFVPKSIKKSSLAKRNIQKFYANKLAVAGLLIVSAFILLTILAPLLNTHDPSLVSPADRFKPISAEHWLGTDSGGRDVVARLLYGGRVSIFVGMLSAMGSALLGVILGCSAGYLGGKVDTVVVFLCEVFQSFPQTIIVLIFIALTGRGLNNLIIIFCFTGWMSCARLVRGKVLSLKEEPFVERCKANGVSVLSIMFRHLLPNTLGPITVSVTMGTAGFVLQEAALSFLGLGVASSIPTWGNVINAARSFDIFQNYPVLWIAPGVTISLFVLGINFFGDGLRDVFDATQ